MKIVRLLLAAVSINGLMKNEKRKAWWEELSTLTLSISEMDEFDKVDAVALIPQGMKCEVHTRLLTHFHLDCKQLFIRNSVLPVANYFQWPIANVEDSDWSIPELVIDFGRVGIENDNQVTKEYRLSG